jgi:excisionase family DNA binding protein
MSLIETLPTGVRTDDDPWLTTKQAAKYLNCHPSTLEKMRCRGEGPAYRKLGGKAVRYRKSSLDVFMEAGDDC